LLQKQSEQGATMNIDSPFEQWRLKYMQGTAASREIMELLALAFEGGRVAEREVNAKLLNDFAKTTMVPVVDSFKAGLKAGAYAILSRGNHEDAPLP